MKIAIIGYGKMGKVIEQIALSRDHKIVTIIDIAQNNQARFKELKEADVAFEFTNPDSAVKNILECFKLNVPVVCGTTGWNKELKSVKSECEKLNVAFFYASNFSLGVNILFEINKRLAEIMNNFDDYDVEITETHHLQKLDSPSGTAITLANDIIDNIKRKVIWKNNAKSKRNILNIISKREEKVPGTHTIKYESGVDKLEFTHEAKSRQGFGLGAVLAGEFIQNKKGIFNMQDLLNL